jgi:hypothetical protein
LIASFTNRKLYTKGSRAIKPGFFYWPNPKVGADQMKVKRRYNKEYNEVFYTIKYTKIYHRDDGPARSFVGPGTYSYHWYKYGEPHRVGGPAVDCLFSTGDFRKVWYYQGLRHRLDGPAEEGLRYQYWYRDGLIHREDGPAVITDYPAIKGNRIEWWLDGQFFISKEAWFKALTAEKQEAVLYSEYFIK